MWHFRLERHDADGNALQPIPVEMRSAVSFSGSVSNGDKVQLSARWRDGTLRPNELRNLTTHARVHNKAYRGARIAAGMIIGLIALGILIGIVFLVISGVSDPGVTPPDWRTPPP
ncbi:hypothetical protein ACIBTP_30590 [Streptomyces avidinii]|uniref:hypothetical protein n=1 Tax=Streptomyces avidinii TaxID=1895 RepID=UPI00379B0670